MTGPLRSGLPLLILALTTACLGGDGGVVGIDAEGVVQGLVYTDLDRNGVAGDVDRTAAGARVALVVPGTTAALSAATTGAQGQFLMPTVPVGRYEVRLPEALIGDSLELSGALVDQAPAGTGPIFVTVGADDTVSVELALAYPALTVAAVRAGDPGARVTVGGVALTATGAFGNRSLHIMDATGALRALNVMGDAIVAGDSVRLLGRISTDLGEVVLTDVQAFFRTAGTVPPPDRILTDQIPTADDGQLAAALAEIVVATVDSSDVVGGDLHLHVDDGSGPGTVVLYRGAGFDFAMYPDSTIIDATGVLVPSGAQGSDPWFLKPRGPADVRIR